MNAKINFEATICHLCLDGLFFVKSGLAVEPCDRDSSGNPFAWEMRQSMTSRDKQKIVADSPVTK
ncbi:hypothetical protein DTW91_02175 [Chryseobacterium sp. SC28]|nr:hypothetical protein DTW91_02175 [Chryseobacterium sp. SC28]